MKRTLMLATAAVLLTACAAPLSQDRTSPSAKLSEGTSIPTMRAAPDVTPWTAYRTFSFNAVSADISDRDQVKIAEIVAYLNANPSLDVAVDGTLSASEASEADRSLGERRANAVRRALMDTGQGVASYKIFNGAFANPQSRKAGEVQVVIGPRSGALSSRL